MEERREEKKMVGLAELPLSSFRVTPEGSPHGKPGAASCRDTFCAYGILALDCSIDARSHHWAQWTSGKQTGRQGGREEGVLPVIQPSPRNNMAQRVVRNRQLGSAGQPSCQTLEQSRAMYRRRPPRPSLVFLVFLFLFSQPRSGGWAPGCLTAARVSCGSSVPRAAACADSSASRGGIIKLKSESLLRDPGYSPVPCRTRLGQEYPRRIPKLSPPFSSSRPRLGDNYPGPSPLALADLEQAMHMSRRVAPWPSAPSASGPGTGMGTG